MTESIHPFEKVPLAYRFNGKWYEIIREYPYGPYIIGHIARLSNKCKWAFESTNIPCVLSELNMREILEKISLLNSEAA